MYNLKDKQQIRVAIEINAMTRFLATRWTNMENVKQLLQLVAKTAIKNAEGAITDYSLSMALHEQLKKRRSVLESFSDDAAMLSFYDQPYLMFDSLRSAVDKVQGNGRETLYDAYQDAFDSFKKALKEEHLAQLKKAEPIGLRSMTKHYLENDDAWDKALADEFTDRNAFTGADTGTGSHGGFVSRVSLIAVVQEKDRHNTRPIDMLLQAAYTHLVDVCKHNNTQAVITDLQQLSPVVESKQPVFTLDFNPQHKLTKVLVALARENWRGLGGENPAQEYQECLAERKAQKPRSPEEVKASRASAVAEISAIFKNALKPESKAAAKRREERTAQEQLAVRNLLKTVS